MTDQPQLSQTEAARVALADEMRRGIHLLVGREHDADELKRLTAELQQEFDQFEERPPRQREMARWETPEGIFVPVDGGELPNSIHRPVSGKGNPWSVPLSVFRDRDRAVCTVTFGDAYEGAPGRCHGGLVSAVYDDLFGFLTHFIQTVAFTASLTVDYKRATPIGEPVDFAVWVDHIDGRKIHMAGEAHVDGEIVTTSTALFIDAKAHFSPQPKSDRDY